MPTSTQRQVASTIDHTLLKATATKNDILTLCQEAKTHGFASVCVNPTYVALASAELAGTAVKVCTVIGLPLGANDSRVKAFETTIAINDGATEVDMVINVGAVKNADWQLVRNDVAAVYAAAKAANSASVVKVIIETCYLTDPEKESLTKLLLEVGVDFVKTSTGFGTGGATVADVTLLKQVVGDAMQIKASGGVRNASDHADMIAAGASRIGTSGGVAIVNGNENTMSY